MSEPNIVTLLPVSYSYPIDVPLLLFKSNLVNWEVPVYLFTVSIRLGADPAPVDTISTSNPICNISSPSIELKYWTMNESFGATLYWVNIAAWHVKVLSEAPSCETLWA